MAQTLVAENQRGFRFLKPVVVVAMANKVARIAWALLSSGNDYRPFIAA